jgi:hypothetical protein
MVKRTSSGFKKLNDKDHSVSACPLRIIHGERTKRTAHLCHAHYFAVVSLHVTHGSIFVARCHYLFCGGLFMLSI